MVGTDPKGNREEKYRIEGTKTVYLRDEEMKKSTTAKYRLAPEWAERLSALIELLKP